MPVDLANITAPDLLSALETAGRAPSLDLIRTAMSRRHDLTAGLLDLLATPPDENWQAQDPRRYAQIHAGHLLIFYREPQAIPIFMRLLRVAGDETAVEWFEQALASYGMGILPELAALINDPSAPVSARLGVTTTLKQLVAEFPTDRAKVIQVLRGALPSLNKKGKPVLPRPRPPKPNLLFTHVSIALVELTDHASRTTIEALFREKWLDPSVLGPFEAYLDRLQNPVPFRSETFNIIERYERLAHESDAPEWDNRSMQDLQAQLHNLNAPASENAGSSASPDLSPAPASASHSAAEADAPIALPQTGTPVGSNDPCPCGSGRKYKHCHGKI